LSWPGEKIAKGALPRPTTMALTGFFLYIFFLLNAGHNLRLLLVAIPPDGRRSLPMQLMKIRFN